MKPIISLGSGRPFEVEAVLSLYTMKRGPEVAALGSMVLMLLNEVPAGAVEMGTIWKAAHHKRAQRVVKNERLNMISERVAITIVIRVANEGQALKLEKQEEVKAENK